MKLAMIKHILSAILLCVCVSAGASPLVWSGTPDAVVTQPGPSGSGIDEVCVVASTAGATLAYRPSSGAPSGVTWSRYSSLGGGYAEAVASRVDGDVSVLVNLEGDMGYLITDGATTYAVWVVDYSRHPFGLTSIAESAEQDCGRVALDVAGSGAEIAYYSITGRRLTLPRDIRLDYRTLVWDEASASYVETSVSETFGALSATIHAAAPLCTTDFTLTGDRFLRTWGREVSVSSGEYAPRSVACRTSAVQSVREADNEVNSPTTGGALGGSAPCEVEFSASVTDAAIFREWQFARNADFDDLTLRVSDLDFTYTFTEEGVTYVRFYCANDDASCDAYGETYEISIGASSLKCPNAFSPLNEDGVNDIWKVSYSSIVSFNCSIFDRRGRRMTSFSNPADGWDGKYGGKFVPAGVYYYVIKARGADGRDYNLSGDINIVDYK